MTNEHQAGALGDYFTTSDSFFQIRPTDGDNKLKALEDHPAHSPLKCVADHCVFENTEVHLKAKDGSPKEVCQRNVRNQNAYNGQNELDIAVSAANFEASSSLISLQNASDEQDYFSDGMDIRRVKAGLSDSNFRIAAILTILCYRCMN